MDEDGIVKICAALGLKHGRAYSGTATWGSHMSIACFPKGTPVLTNRGYKSIDLVDAGDLVLTRASGYQEVVGIHKRKFTGELVSIRCRGPSHFQLTGTDNHRVPVIRRSEGKSALNRTRYLSKKELGRVDIIGRDVVAHHELVELQDLREGDFIMLPEISESGQSRIVIDVESYQTVYKMSNGGERCAPTVIPTSLPIDECLATILGLWLAEGSIGGCKGNADINFANFTFARGEPAVSLCLNTCQSVFGITPILHEGASRETRSDVRLYNWLVARWFRDIMGTGAANKRIPDFIMTAPVPVAGAFLDAYCMGDGESYSYYKGSWKGISTISRTIANQLPILLARLRIASRVSTRAARVDKHGVNHRESYTISWSKSQNYCAGKRFNGGMWYPIKVIKRHVVEKIDVYNLAVNIDETYTVGPFVVKNCPLAIKTHGDPHDDNLSCSVEVVDDGPSRVKCWSGNCGFKGSLLRMLRAALGYREKTPEMDALLADVSSVESLTLSARHARTRKAIQNAFDPPPSNYNREVLPERFFKPFSGKIPKYAVERGITVETAKAWGLGYDVDGGFLVFPVRRRDGKLVGLVGRAVSDRAKRTHHNYMGLDKSKHMFGAHMLQPGKPVVVVESCIDTLNTWQALDGRASVVATLGEGFSERHALTMSAMRPPAVYIFTDGDNAGRLMGNKIAYALHGHGPVRAMECPWGPLLEVTADGRAIQKKIDPSDLPDDYIVNLFENAPLVRRKIKWSNPPPFFDPCKAT